MALCSQSNNDWFRVYLIRKICTQHGVEFVQSLLKVKDVRWIFPEEVLQQVLLSDLQPCPVLFCYFIINTNINIISSSINIILFFSNYPYDHSHPDIFFKQIKLFILHFLLI